MADPDPARDRILDATEAVLRRFGPEKATVVAVAKALGMSHANIYRFFPSKAELHAAVADRWLKVVSAPLARIADEPGPAPDRLGRWFHTLAELKRRKVLDDPELFANYHAVAEASTGVVATHLGELLSQLARIIADGTRSGSFAVEDAESAARTVLLATYRFHHPYHIREAAGRPSHDDLDRVLAVLMAGLKAGVV